MFFTGENAQNPQQISLSNQHECLCVAKQWMLLLLISIMEICAQQIAAWVMFNYSRAGKLDGSFSVASFVVKVTWVYGHKITNNVTFRNKMLTTTITLTCQQCCQDLLKCHQISVKVGHLQHPNLGHLAPLITFWHQWESQAHTTNVGSHRCRWDPELAWVFYVRLSLQFW